MKYDGYDMEPMQQCSFPAMYHNMYGHMYPGIETDIMDCMAYPAMYPDIYYRIYPHVSRVCDKMDNPYIIYPSETHLENMINECYDACVKAMPDLESYAGIKEAESVETDSQQIRRRPILRDLISIILLSELFRRRRRFTPRHGYGPGYGADPGYGFDPGYRYPY